jgi:hypothetical protein
VALSCRNKKTIASYEKARENVKPVLSLIAENCIIKVISWYFILVNYFKKAIRLKGIELFQALLIIKSIV